MNFISSLSLAFLLASSSSVQANGDKRNVRRAKQTKGSKNSKGPKTSKKSKGGVTAIVKLDSVGGSKTNGVLQIHGNGRESSLVTIEASKASVACADCKVGTFITDDSCDSGLLKFEDSLDVDFYYNTFGSEYTRSAFTADSTVESAIEYGVKFALFDEAGEMAACGTAEAETSSSHTLTAQMGPYPGSTSLVSGEVKVTYGKDGSFTFAYDLEGLEVCEECGIHIHAGVSCDTNENVEGHGWNSNIVRDLWTAEGGAYYKSVDGTASDYFNMFNGFGYGGNYHHAVVVHSADARIGCGVLM